MDDLKAILQRLTAKSQVLVEKYRALEVAKATVDDENRTLKQEIKDIKQQLQRLQTENEYLTIARNINRTPEDIAGSKAILSQMVRDVDKCISQLTD